MKTKIFCDSADFTTIKKLNSNLLVKGFTTNPSLMRKAGITDYKKFAFEILNKIKEKPISFEVFSDEFDEMENQALEIASWASNVNVKIPITNTKVESSVNLINKISEKGVSVNVTAMMTLEQVKSVLPGLACLLYTSDAADE